MLHNCLCEQRKQTADNLEACLVFSFIEHRRVHPDEVSHEDWQQGQVLQASC